MKYLLINQESERLRFRPLEKDDAKTWLEFFMEKGVELFFGMGNIPTPEERCKEWFNKIEDRYKNNTGGLNALIDKKTNAFIGQCGLLVQNVDGVQELEIGYSIIKQYRNKGYASEAAQKCRDYAFEQDFSDHLISIIKEDNIRSRKVAKKNGMKFLRKTKFWDMNVDIYAITKQEWLELKKRP